MEEQVSELYSGVRGNAIGCWARNMCVSKRRGVLLVRLVLSSRCVSLHTGAALNNGSKLAGAELLRL